MRCVSFSGTKGSKTHQSDACQFFQALATKYQQPLPPKARCLEPVTCPPPHTSGMEVVVSKHLPTYFPAQAFQGNKGVSPCPLLWPWGEAVETTLWGFCVTVLTGIQAPLLNAHLFPPPIPSPHPPTPLPVSSSTQVTDIAPQAKCSSH